jgi:hypothetical protein
LRAAAVTALDARFGKSAAGIGGSRERQGAGEQGQIKRGPDGKAAETMEQGRLHRKRVLPGIEKKPIALGS